VAFRLPSTTAADAKDATLTADTLKAALQMLDETRANDPRPYGRETVFVMNAETYAQAREQIHDSLRIEIRQRVKVDGTWRNLKFGEVLMAHEDGMAALTESPYWQDLLKSKWLNRQLSDGKITYDQWARLVGLTEAADADDA
jgi:hypothetical protein